MSKIGRKPIATGGVTVEVKDQKISYKGPKKSGEYILPTELKALVSEGSVALSSAKDVKKLSAKERRSVNCLWGLHRALLNNELQGASQEFSQLVEINGLGYKAALSGKKIVFTLGYSHKIDFDIPEGVSVEIEKSGQKLTVKSSNKFLVGQVCSDMKKLRQPEPYKGKGIKLATEEIRRKPGKAKAA